MPQTPFDPCRQWLGIDAVNLSNPRLVLGIEPGEMDSLAVLRAAEARLSVLRGIAPGPFDMARNALVKRVEEAREAALSQITTTARPGPEIGTHFQPPPPPGGSAARTAAFDSFAPAAVPPADSSHPSAPTWASPDVATARDGFVAVKTSPKYRKQSPWSGPFFVLLAGLAAAAAWLALTKAQRTKVDKDGQREVAIAEQKTEAVERSDEPVVPARKRREPPRRSREDATESDEVEEPEDPSSDAAVSTSRAPAARTVKPPPPPAVAEPPVAEPTGDKDENSAEVRSRIEAGIRNAFAALQNAEYDAAEAALVAVAAAAEAENIATMTRVARWRDLATYAKGFAKYRDEALATVESGHEYEIDGLRIGIVEIDDRKIIYRDRGKNVTKKRGNIPTKILMAIVTDWFDAKPANNLYLGAYHATKAEPDVAKARECWERARAGGSDASAVLALLDDPVLRAIATPDPE